MATPLEALLEILDLEPIEVNIFRGLSPDETRQRVFGGQVAAQALVAAGRTVERGRVHSLHSYFLRPGDPTVPILYEVDRIRDGRSFTTRRVVAIQHGHAIFNLAASFHTEEEGLVHQEPMPEVPEPESIATVREQVDALGPELAAIFSRPNPIDQRFVGGLRWVTRGRREPRQRLWMRADGEIPAQSELGGAGDPADALVHAAVVTYASDMTLFDSILQPHDIRWEDELFMGASLDHCMWFHRPFRADEWLLFDQESPVAYGARGLARGMLYTQAGALVVSVVQEGLVRFGRRDPQPAPDGASASAPAPAEG